MQWGRQGWRCNGDLPHACWHSGFLSCTETIVCAPKQALAVYRACAYCVVLVAEYAMSLGFLQYMLYLSRVRLPLCEQGRDCAMLWSKLLCRGPRLRDWSCSRSIVMWWNIFMIQTHHFHQYVRFQISVCFQISAHICVLCKHQFSWKRLAATKFQDLERKPLHAMPLCTCCKEWLRSFVWTMSSFLLQVLGGV